jgi:choline dehydrogenase-like flavoprotein
VEPQRFDVIVVGAGSAGVPLATRLAERDDRSVLLIDAGPHYPTIADYPPDLRHSGLQGAMDPGHPNNWAFDGLLTSQGARSIVPRGKVVGGGSAVNGTLFERGTPEDFAEWAARGNDLWSFERVLPYFKRLESDLDVQDEWHGQDGPIPVRRHPEDEFTAIDRAFMETSVDHGFPIDRDMNAPDSYGAGALTTNSVDGIRMNVAHCYLEPALRRGGNLTVLGDCQARRVLFAGRRATGVEVEHRGRRRVFEADEVVLSSGAIKSAHLLLLSGIGPAADLRRLGIDVVLDNPNVGADFTEHVQGATIVYRVDRLPALDPLEHPVAHVGMHYTAEGSPHRGDLFTVVHCLTHNAQLLHGRSPLAAARMGLRMMRTMSVRRILEEARLGRCLAVGVALMKGHNRGQLTIASDDPMAKPQIAYGHLEHAEDRARLRYGTRLMAAFLESGPFAKLGVRRISPTDEELASDAKLDAHFHENLFTYFHMAGTCRMGPDSDETAVVDQRCRVRGVDALRVVDTSIWPETVRRCTNATAVMTGERAADLFD